MASTKYDTSAAEVLPGDRLIFGDGEIVQVTTVKVKSGWVDIRAITEGGTRIAIDERADTFYVLA